VPVSTPSSDGKTFTSSAQPDSTTAASTMPPRIAAQRPEAIRTSAAAPANAAK
jgi:hypothetical protein